MNIKELEQLDKEVELLKEEVDVVRELLLIKSY
jgi:hypothetical protein